MANRSTYQHVSSLRPGRSMFDLSYEKKFTCDMGQLIPVMCDELVPGDKFKIGNQAVIRFQPLVAPVLHEINMYVHYFFVPYRLLWEDWEDFITGGIDGDDTTALPYWTPTDPTGYAEGSLWDFLGFPVDIDPELRRPLNFPRLAYNLIYNEYYRDETTIPEVALTNEAILNRCWEKDYFTSSLPWQQRSSSPPALPISGNVPVTGIGTRTNVWPLGPVTAYQTGETGTVTYTNAKDASGATTDRDIYIEEDGTSGFPNIRVDLSQGTTFDVADLRLAFQIQKWMERNARAGARYTEFLKGHFGVSPKDSRLQRPEYCGGSKSPIIISEVLQTSSTDATTPQGNMAGHGISASQSYAGSYFAEEFGLIMGLMSVMPRSTYQNGINRQWLRQTKYDFYFPEFANLSEQAIEEVEICAHDGNTVNNIRLFGYQGRYDELRTKDNMVCSGMRSTFDYWHLGRQFDPASPPSLNAAFLTCTPRKDIFAVPSDPGLIVSFANIIKAFRPLPIQSEPGLIDHN